MRLVSMILLVLLFCLWPPFLAPASGQEGRLEASGTTGDGPRCTVDGPVRTYAIRAPEGGFRTERGVMGKPIEALSGERIEVRWQGLFPHYELWYYPAEGRQGRMVGRCHFAGGCNKGFYTVKEDGNSGKIACFLGIVWESLDYSTGSSLYLERFRHVYDVSRDYYTVRKDLLHYACPPPLAQYPDSCTSKCEPPYQEEVIDGVSSPRIFRTRLIEEKKGFLRGNNGDLPPSPNPAAY